ncbi:GNAT family N-acetyltransferase [Gordonia hydrophobica]|uniref:N-acetyltransferase n=1 Tax=Gordonia hydrophobica TaxID=40516 RepID=A0ABZ2TZZ3_9ACTN|nr:N-acetyltransferase [Gordonia hydrophobica]MBM7369418.1 putative N-acetyltransferase YhbS [Gordonia hydrophobica]
MTTPWTVRPETPADVTGIRAVTVAAFPSQDEADLVEALRADANAWIDGLSYVAEVDGVVVGHALLTRCHVDGADALALAPCSVLPEYQRTGVGTATITALLGAARERGEGAVIILGHADYYPRFGFVPASRFGVTAGFDVPDEAFMAMPSTPGAPVPAGTVAYPPAFGV